MATTVRSAGYARSCWTVPIRGIWPDSGPRSWALRRSSGIQAGSRWSRHHMVSGFRSRALPAPMTALRRGAERSLSCTSTSWSVTSPLLTTASWHWAGCSSKSTCLPGLALVASRSRGGSTGILRATHSVSLSADRRLGRKRTPCGQKRARLDGTLALPRLAGDVKPLAPSSLGVLRGNGDKPGSDLLPPHSCDNEGWQGGTRGPPIPGIVDEASEITPISRADPSHAVLVNLGLPVVVKDLVAESLACTPDRLMQQSRREGLVQVVMVSVWCPALVGIVTSLPRLVCTTV
jgi:hypothetical protein